ncbi:MAG: hypothetical protein RLZZ336_2223 [Cyanobacteriota bacterium]
MSWDPSVLRKYNTTGHFRLLNQVRSELKANPLVRPKEGERIGEVNRSKALVRAIEAKQGSQSRGRRQAGRDAGTLVVIEPQMGGESNADHFKPLTGPTLTETEDTDPTGGFRDRLNAVDLR